MHPLRLVLAIAFILGASGAAHGALPPGHRAAPELLEPAPGAVVYEGAATLAWTAPQRGGRHFVLVSRAPFDASGWRALPERGDVVAHEVAQPVAALDALGATLAPGGPLYWAAAHLDPGAGRWSFSTTRVLEVIPRFAHAAQPVPELTVSPLTDAAPEVRAGPDRIRLAAGIEIDPAAGAPEVEAALRAPASPEARRRSLLVYFGDQDPAAVRARILSAGGAITAYLPDRTFLVRLSAGATESAGDFASAVGAAWAGTFEPAYKLSPRLTREGGAPQRATVLLFPDGDLAAVTALATARGAGIERASSNAINRILRVTAPPAALEALALDPDVAWIEPYVPPVAENDLDQWVVQTGTTNSRRVWDMGIRGEGQVVMTSDSGVNTNHNQFRDPALSLGTYGDYPTHRKVIAYKNGSDDPGVAFGDHGSFHGTHTGCTAVGSDDGVSSSARDGIAKAAKLYFMDISGASLGTGVAPLPDLNDLFQPSYAGNAGGAARIASNSWGSPVAGAYTVDAYTTDQFMWNHPDYLIFFATGNSGPSGATVGSPATAKNAVGAGGTGNGASQGTIYGSTSRGPTVDARRKPTLCAPAASVNSAISGVATYASYSGTSMASPGLAGAATLIRQYLTEGWYPTGVKVPANGFAPSAALLKAMCINAAVNAVTDFTAPDQNIGYGRMNADEVLYFAGDARRLLLADFTSGLGHQQAIEYQVNVVDGAVPLEVSLCWTDYPGSPMAAIQIVNNLDLTVTDGVTTYKGNVYAGGNSATGGVYDDRNVEESVRVAVPSTGVWTIRIEGTAVNAGPQPFGLCITGGVGTTAGALALDRAVYGSAGTVALRVVDTNAGASVSVTVVSDTEPGGETVTLPGANGLYTATLPLSPFDGSSGDGTLQVSHGDALVATYTDASPAATLEAEASVSFNRAVITNVHAEDQGSGSIGITWTTDVNASSTVEYGPTPALGSSASDATATLAHALTIPNLGYNQSYWFDVLSEDLYGNVTRDDNGGAHYRFTTGEKGELLLVYGSPNFERAHRYASALDNLGWSRDVWTGTLADEPDLGDLSSGLRSYKAVWWQPGLEQYPAFTDAARGVLTDYLDGGGRLAVTGHDIAWGLSDPSSPSYTAERASWMQTTLHTLFQSDPPGWGAITGIAADPISGAYTGGVSYAEHRAGGAGDNVDPVSGGGTATAVWRSPTPDDCAVRWQASGPLGNPGLALWGGTASRLVGMYFEWSSMNPLVDVSVTREAVMSKTLEWLMGRARPTVAVTAPNGGETLTGNSVAVSWTESTSGGTGVGQRRIEYSPDGGNSWQLVSASPGASPYLWDLTSLANTGEALVRVTLHDDGPATLSRTDVSNALFAIQRAGADLVGPAVVAGSIVAGPNPIDNQAPATLTATVTESHSGGALVSAAEWSHGASAAPAGSGVAMSGGFPGTTVAVSAALTTGSFAPGTRTLWVRGRDAAGNWGAPARLDVAVNGAPVDVAEAAPRMDGLLAPAPNPVLGVTTIAFTTATDGPLELAVFDVQGRKVRALIDGFTAAGVHSVRWDRADGSGARVSPGVYFVRMRAGGRSFERRIVALR